MKTAEIRRRFLDYFQHRDHVVRPSASLILDDPTLLFVNAGMVQFKPYLLGQETPPFTRATTIQKVLRTEDIEEVGADARHNTFFEMAGNFSFGDYYKEQAIAFAWELITSPQDRGGYGFDPGSIWVTVYLDDDEAAGLWQSVAGLPEERIQRRGMKDNYWSMGVPGPCGPDSEIWIDRGPDYGPDGGPIVDEDRFLEIWNLVFMEQERGAGGAKEDYPILGPLPAKNIDTGMGIERVACLLQGVDNVYESDLLVPTIALTEQLTGRAYGARSVDDVRFRVIADHARSAVMLIADGVTPGNTGRGYVLRRLLRRIIRNARLLGCEDPVMRQISGAVRDAMSPSYPELVTDFDRIAGYAEREEEAFRRTLASGTTIFDQAAAATRDRGGTTLSGEQAFRLHDTYGFPIELTLEMAGEHGLAVDETGFRSLMAEQRRKAQADAAANKGGHLDLSAYRDVLDEVGASVFRGYEELQSEASVRAILGAEGRLAEAGEGEIVKVVLDRTPFYAESGGQDSDAGRIAGDGVELEVLDVQRPVKGLIVHDVRVTKGELVTGAAVHAEVDGEWRLGACQAHSGTHVVHAALREVLGPTALQSGSYNKPGYLRLDFAWPSGLSAGTLSEVEEVVNLAVRRDLPVRALYTDMPGAKEMGALALFGETYADEVRVVEIGGPWSRELCGGTHVAGSAQIGPLALTGEFSVAAGVRRVEAVVGIDAFRFLAAERALASALTREIGGTRDTALDRVRETVRRLRAAEKELARLRTRQVLAGAGELAGGARDVNGVAFVGARVPDGIGGGELRTLVNNVRGRLGADRPAVVVLVGTADGKVPFAAAANDAARDRGITAGAVVAALAPAVAGRGGGKDDLAQGSGTDREGVAAALAAAERQVAAGGIAPV